MDSTSVFRDFMHAEVEEIKKYIQSKGGDSSDQELAMEWIWDHSAMFRKKWFEDRT